MENLNLIRQKLESHYSNLYRKIWVQSSSRPNSRDIMLTLFPISIGERYQIISMRNLKEVSYQEIFTILEKELSNINID